MARSDHTTLLAQATTLGFCGGCASDAGGRGLLPGPPDGPIRLSEYRPERPFEPVAAGLLARTVFSEQTASGLLIEVRELLVAPKQTTGRHLLPAPALLYVRAATGAAITRGDAKASALAAGASLKVAQDEPIAIENPGDEPLVVTVYLFSAR